MNRNGNVALVTGAGTGIGRAVALALLGAGHRVALAGRRATPLEATAALAGQAATRAMVLPTDVTAPAEVDALFAAIGDQAGRLDLLFNNAGMFPKAAAIEDVAYDDWAEAVAVNLTGAFLVAQGAYRMMKRQTPRGGRIINNGSVAAHVPRPRSAGYAATKHAITGLTRSLALEGREFDIACGQIDIGNAATDLIVKIGDAVREQGGAAEPTIDLKPVADAVLYMAGLPLNVNVLFMTVIATKMPFVGRG